MDEDDIEIPTDCQLIVTAKALVTLGDRLLFVSDDEKNWFLPGGELEPHEDLLTAVTHSVHETSGLMIKPLRLFCVYESYDQQHKIHAIENVFHSRFKEIEDEDHEVNQATMKFHHYYTLDEIIDNENIFPRFLTYGHWLKSNRSGVQAIYKGLICAR